MKSGQIGNIYPFLRKIANGPNDGKNVQFQIPFHVEQNLSPVQCAENIAQHFATISQEYQPINFDVFSPSLQAFLVSAEDEVLPIISEYDVYMKILKSKKSHSTVKGEVHPKLIQTFNVEFSKPAAIIFNKMINTQTYPDQWKNEHGIPSPKSSNSPENLDQLRIIFKQNF